MYMYCVDTCTCILYDVFYLTIHKLLALRVSLHAVNYFYMYMYDKSDKPSAWLHVNVK